MKFAQGSETRFWYKTSAECVLPLLVAVSFVVGWQEGKKKTVKCMKKNL